MLKFVRSLSHFGGDLKKFKVSIVGANGGIGRALALNLKLNKNVSDLALWDITNTAGVREDLSHIDTIANVHGYSGDEKALIESLKCSDLVAIVAGQAHSPKFSSRELMFEANAELMIKFMKATASACHPNMPFIHIVTNPVNTLVPLCAEYLKEIGCYDPRKLIGSTSIDTIRASTFLGKVVNYNPSKIMVPVFGGHSTKSIVPVVSQSKPKFLLSDEQMQQIENRVIIGAYEVTNATKEKRGSFLSTSYGIAKFCDSVRRAMYGHKDVVEVGYVAADINDLEFFACRFSMARQGITKCHKIPELSPYEMQLYWKSVKDVQLNIDKAKEFMDKYKAKK